MWNVSVIRFSFKYFIRWGVHNEYVWVYVICTASFYILFVLATVRFSRQIFELFFSSVSTDVDVILLKEMLKTTVCC